jgi:hypothetical protein
MPRQILTIELAGLTAGDYLAHVRDPEPPALVHGLRSVTVRAQPLGDTVEATLVWEHAAPVPHVAARTAGLPLVAEVVRVESSEVRDHPAERPAAARAAAPRPGRIAALTERVAARIATQPRPASSHPLVVRWA